MPSHGSERKERSERPVAWAAAGEHGGGVGLRRYCWCGLVLGLVKVERPPV